MSAPATRSTETKKTAKPRRHTSPFVSLEDQLVKAQKNTATALARQEEIQAKLDAQNHESTMVLGGTAILRRLLRFSEKFWDKLSAQLETVLPGESDQEHVRYWLSHRPKPEIQSEAAVAQPADSASQAAKSSGETPTEKPLIQKKTKATSTGTTNEPLTPPEQPGSASGPVNQEASDSNANQQPHEALQGQTTNPSVTGPTNEKTDDEPTAIVHA